MCAIILLEVANMKSHTTADRLNQIMKERGMRQIDILEAAKPFCEKYGVKLGKNDLSQYVNGKVEPGQEKLTILGMALGVSEAWLMGYETQKERNANKKGQPTEIDGLSLENVSQSDIKTIKAFLEMPDDQRNALAKLLGISE